MSTPRNAHTYDHLAAFAVEHPWAVTPAMLAVIARVISTRLAGEPDDEAGLVAAAELRAARDVQASGPVVAVIPIHGVIAPRMNLFSEISGGTTFEGLGQDLQQAVDNPEVQSIVLDINSPGGNVAGATEFARQVLAARTKKPIYAHAQHQACSAAYWLASCATEVIATPSASVGSIGVFALYDDVSAALEKLGVKRQVFAAGRYKAEGVDGGPLTDEAKAYLKARVDGAYGRFIGDVAKGRGLSTGEVRTSFGEGRAVDADEALALGMIDRIDTFATTLARAAESQQRPHGHYAQGAPAPAGTAQERASATAQAPSVTVDPALLAAEQRWLDLMRRGLES